MNNYRSAQSGNALLAGAHDLSELGSIDVLLEAGYLSAPGRAERELQGLRLIEANCSRVQAGTAVWNIGHATSMRCRLSSGVSRTVTR